MNCLMALYRGLRDVIYPNLCPACDRPIASDLLMCPDCLQSLPRTEQAALRGNLTEQLFYKNPRFQRGAAFLFYDHQSTSHSLIHALKFAERPELARYLAEQAASEFLYADFFDEIDLIVPIPLHPLRERERGYNQSEWIARGLSARTGIPVDVQHLLRCRNTRQQAKLGRQERDENMEGAFVVVHPEELKGKHILLVDDVITTGATVRACMKALAACRGCEISVFALGKAV